jgi:DNA-binding NarL/FixJ family response regulator
MNAGRLVQPVSATTGPLLPMRFEGQQLSRLRIERVEQSLRLFEVGRVEAFGEPTMDRRENIACFGSLALVTPEAGEAEGNRLPAIMITGQGDVPMAVGAMKAGAADFIEKPIGCDELFASIEHALEHTRDSVKSSVRREAAATRVAGLTPRQRQIMDLVLAGHPSKNIAAALGISQRTVENHRAAVMKETASHSLSALIRLARRRPRHGVVTSPLTESAARQVPTGTA